MGSITNLKENKTFFIPCGCRNEILMIEYDHEYKIVDLAIYEHYVRYRQRMSIWQIIRYCCQVIWNKKPYGDQITLDIKQIKELKSFLNSLDLT